jgi:hypothetical protein
MPRLSVIGLLLMTVPLSSNAHHSGAMFDTQRTISLSGTVKTFQWTNPHCYIQLFVPGASGVHEWSIEMASVSQLYRRGWRPGSLQAGDKVTVVVNPVRDGSNGGQYVSAITAQGRRLESAVTPAVVP